MTNNPEKMSNEMKPVLRELRESLPFIKTILIAPIAWGYALGERYLKLISIRQEESKRQAYLLAQQKKSEERARRKEEREAQEASKIAEEKRAEVRAQKIREEERKITPRQIIHTALLTTSTIGLLLGVSYLAPIAKWTHNVNECVKDTAFTEDKKISFSDRVKSCNRG